MGDSNEALRSAVSHSQVATRRAEVSGVPGPGYYRVGPIGAKSDWLTLEQVLEHCSQGDRLALRREGFGDG